MKKLLKILFVLVTVLVLAAILVPVALRGTIEEVVKTEANARLRARLDFERLEISLVRHFPHASLSLRGLTLTGAEPFAGDTILAARRIGVVVDLLSLFGDGGFRVTKVIVADPAVHARKLADGRVNWDVMKPTTAPEAAGTATEPSEPSSFRLSLRDVRITDAVVRYDDDSTGMRFSASPADLRLRGDLSTVRNELELHLAARDMRLLAGGVPLLAGAEAGLDATIEADLAEKRFTLSDNRLRLNAIELALDGWVQLLDDGLEVDLRAGCEQVGFKEVLSLVPAFYMRDFRKLTAGGELAMHLWAKGVLRGRTLPAFEWRTEVRDGSIQYSSLPEAIRDINVALAVSNPGGTMDATVVDLRRFSLDMAGNRLAATLRATSLASDPTFRAAVDGRLDLGTIRKVYPLEKGVALDGVVTADVRVAARMSDIDRRRYERIEAAGTFVVEGVDLKAEGLPEVRIRRAAATITPAAMTLGDLGATVGRSDLSANGQLTDYLGYLLHGGVLSGRLYVKSDLLDLNEWMQAAAASEGDVAIGKSVPAADAQPASVLEVPRNLALSLNTELRSILYKKMTITDLSGEISLADGTLSLAHLRLGVFGGRASASGSYSTAADPARPALRLKADIAGASFKRTFEETETVQRLVPLFAKTGGDYSLRLDMDTRLDSQMQPELQTLQASGELRTVHVRLEGIEAFDALARALDDERLKRIEARDLAIRFRIDDGRVATQPFDLNMGDTKLTFSGWTGLDRKIDYTVRVALPAAATGGVLSKVDVRIGGTFSDPKITLGVKEAVREAARNIVEEQIQKLTGSESLSEEIGKQAEHLREEARKAGERLVEAARTQRTKLIDAAAEKGPLARLAAEKAGDKLVEEAQRQADRLVEEADKQIEKLSAPSEEQ